MNLFNFDFLFIPEGHSLIIIIGLFLKSKPAMQGLTLLFFVWQQQWRLRSSIIEGEIFLESDFIRGDIYWRFSGYES